MLSPIDIYICICFVLIIKTKRDLFQQILYFFNTYYSQSVVVFNQKPNREITEHIMDSESRNESEDYSYDESSDGDEYNSNVKEELTASFENVSTTSRKWRKGNFNPRLFSFDSSSCGLSSTIKNLTLETPLDFFELFFDRKLLEMMVKEINRFHTNSERTSYSHTAPWIDTTINEMYTFLAMVMLMPHSKKNRICDYWSTDHLIATPTL